MVYIYALIDPRNDEVKYIGQTIHLDHRFKGHIESPNNAKDRNKHKKNWINQLLREGMHPILKVLEVCDDAAWSERERYWIKYYKELGCNLTNLTDGGEGSLGRVYSEETILKFRKAWKTRKPASSETRKKLSIARKGKKLSAETRMRMSAAQMGNTKSRGRIVSEETKKKLSDANKGMVFSDEHRKHIGEGHKGIIPWNKGKKLDKPLWKNNPMLGKHHTEEAKSKMRKPHKKKQE